MNKIYNKNKQDFSRAKADVSKKAYFPWLVIQNPDILEFQPYTTKKIHTTGKLHISISFSLISMINYLIT